MILALTEAASLAPCQTMGVMRGHTWDAALGAATPIAGFVVLAGLLLLPAIGGSTSRMGFSRILQGGLIPKGGLKCLGLKCVLDHIINTLEVASLGKDVSLKLYIMKSSDELIFNVIFGNV